LEPALNTAVVGGLHAATERHVRPESLTAGLVADLRRRGAHIVEGAEVTFLRRGSGGTWALGGPSLSLVADKVLLAGGALTGRTLATLGTSIRLEGAKGYSITSRGTGTAPTHALYFVESKVACSPYDDGVRLAGTLELAGIDVSLNARRIGMLATAADRYLADWRPTGADRSDWSGLRPLAPDGLPYIGPVPDQPGMYAATGHAMLGITLAPATGAVVAQMMLEVGASPDLHAFRLDR
jgi:D-amino-acid dehydrogenase